MKDVRALINSRIVAIPDRKVFFGGSGVRQAVCMGADLGVRYNVDRDESNRIRKKIYKKVYV